MSYLKSDYYSIHWYLRKYNQKPESCQNCNLFTTKLDIANITGIYDRDFKNYRYLCKKCHNGLDAHKRIIDKSSRLCHICSRKTYVRKDGWEYWYHINDEWTCDTCYQRNHRRSKRYK